MSINMPNKNNFKNINLQLDAVTSEVLRRQESTAATTYKAEFETYVRPFVSSINFGTETEIRDGNLVTRIGPLPTGTVERAYGPPVDGATLYKWLDDGTDVRYAQMPSGFSNETSPNSLNSRRVSSYNRSLIYIDKNKAHSGLEPRNISKLIDEKLFDTYAQRINGGIKRIIELTR